MPFLRGSPSITASSASSTRCARAAIKRSPRQRAAQLPGHLRQRPSPPGARGEPRRRRGLALGGRRRGDTLRRSALSGLGYGLCDARLARGPCASAASLLAAPRLRVPPRDSDRRGALRSRGRAARSHPRRILLLRRSPPLAGERLHGRGPLGDPRPARRSIALAPRIRSNQRRPAPRRGALSSRARTTTVALAPTSAAAAARSSSR